MDFVFSSKEVVKPEVTNDVSLRSIDNRMCDVSHWNKIKEEPLDFELDPYAREKSIRKVQMKSEATSLKSDSNGDNDCVKLELLQEELDIKPELFVSPEYQASDLHPQKHKCNVCDYATIYKSNLNQHMKIHTGEKRFNCTVCTYTCVRKYSLKMHMRTHTGEKPFQCSVCSYASIQNCTLKLHMKIHTGEIPFKCNACIYTSRDKRAVKRHMKIHTSNASLQKSTYRGDIFQCFTCDSKFERKDNLRKHIKIHTIEKLLKMY